MTGIRSVFDHLRHAYRIRRTERIIRALPADIRADIGWDRLSASRGDVQPFGQAMRRAVSWF